MTIFPFVKYTHILFPQRKIGSSAEKPIDQSRLIAFMDRMVQTKKATAVGQKSSCLREADYEQPVARQSGLGR